MKKIFISLFIVTILAPLALFAIACGGDDPLFKGVDGNVWRITVTEGGFTSV